MRTWIIGATWVVLLAVLPQAGRAQVPGVPGAGAPAGAAGVPTAAGAGGAAPAAAGGAAPTAAPAAAPRNLWSFLCPTQAQKQNCQQKFCKSQFGQLINNTLKPIGALSGGILGPPCPAVDPAALALPAESAEGAAARIKKDEANAKARAAAVRYLATVDCRYWPEAQDALVNALRADRNECVRLAAAHALGSGCCCTKVTILALTRSVNGTKDNDPAEPSPCVRAAAWASLQHCLSCFAEEVTQPEVPPELPPKAEPSPKEPPPETAPPPNPIETLPQPNKIQQVAFGSEPKKLFPRGAGSSVPLTPGAPRPTVPMYPATYYRSLTRLSVPDVLAEARQALKAWRPPPAATELARTEAPGLFEIIGKAFERPPSPEPPLLPVRRGTSRVGSGRPAGDNPATLLRPQTWTPQGNAGS
jgi:hypothetical protein